MPESFSSIVPDEAPRARLDRWLAAELPEHSRSRIRAAIEAGHARINGVKVDSPARSVKPGDRVEFVPPEPAADEAPEPQAMDLAILYEDDDVLVLDKPAGLVVHPGAGTKEGTLVNALLHHCGAQLSLAGDPARPGIVHRLDKETSGVMVIAKTQAAYLSLTRQFAARRIGRRYCAFVHGHPAPQEGRIEAPIARHPVQRKKMAVREGGKPAVTQYRTCRLYRLESGEPLAAELTCRLETGRTHQIRVHLAHIGHPLFGDPVYGRKSSRARSFPAPLAQAIDTLARQALHAETLSFSHPAHGDNLKFTSPLPYDLEQFKRTLERYTPTDVRSAAGEED